MTLQYIIGDIIEAASSGGYDVLAHGCNCFSTMGAGVARVISRAYPDALKVDRESPLTPQEKFGTCTIAKCGDIHVANLYTQYNYGTHHQQVDYNQLSSAFYQLSKWISSTDKPRSTHVLIPRIGVGLGGGDWDIISDIIEHRLRHYLVTVCSLK